MQRRSFYPPPKSQRESVERWSRRARSRSPSISSSEWAGGLRSCASEVSSVSKGKGKGRGKGRASETSASESEAFEAPTAVAVTTSLEVPLKALRSSWKAAVASASSAEIEVDASRRDGFGRITIVGRWRQNLMAYQCLLPLFFEMRSTGPRIWRSKKS